MQNENNNSPLQENSNKLPGVWKLFVSAIKLYKDRFLLFLEIVIVPVVLTIITIAYTFLLFPNPELVRTGEIAIPQGIALGGFLLTLATVLFFIWSQVSLIFAVSEKGKLSFTEAYSRGWMMFRSYVWVSILTTLVVSVALLPGVVFAIAINLSFLLLIIPGIVFAVWFAFSVFVLVNEGKLGTQALKQSKKYVEGRWFSVAWRQLGVGIITSLIFLIVFSITILIVDPQGFTTDITTQNSAQYNQGNPVLSSLSYLYIAILAPLTTSYLYLLYKNLKQGKKSATNSPQI